MLALITLCMDVGREMKFPADLDLDTVTLPAVEAVALDFEGIWSVVRNRLLEVQ